MKQLWKKIKRMYELIVRKIHGHKLDCCNRIRCSCRKCPFNTEEVKKIVKEQKKKELKGYLDISIRR